MNLWFSSCPQLADNLKLIHGFKVGDCVIGIMRFLCEIKDFVLVPRVAPRGRSRVMNVHECYECPSETFLIFLISNTVYNRWGVISSRVLAGTILWRERKQQKSLHFILKVLPLPAFKNIKSNFGQVENKTSLCSDWQFLVKWGRYNTSLTTLCYRLVGTQTLLMKCTVKQYIKVNLLFPPSQTCHTYTLIFCYILLFKTFFWGPTRNGSWATDWESLI